MDISRLRKKDLKVWILLFDGVEVLCRHLTQSAFDEIQRQCRSVRFDPRSHEKTEEIDDAKFRSLLARAVVVDWRGLTDDGQGWPCTPENIDYFMEECTEFRLLVRGAPLSLEKMLALDREAAAKNSVTTSAPATTTPA